MRARSFAILVTALVLTLGSAALAAVVDPHKAIGGKGSQYEAAVNDTYFTYTQWDRRRPHTYLLFARERTSGTTFRVNKAGTNAGNSSLEPGTNRILYQQWNKRGSALYFYDLDTRARTKPGPINSDVWEWDPRVSSAFITYFEDRFSSGKWHSRLRIYDRATGVTRTIDSWTWTGFLTGMGNGSLGERYAAYTVCTRRLCSAYLYDSTSRTTQRIPTVGGRHQYSPGIDELNGSVYFARADDGGCGRRVGLWQLPLSLVGDAALVVDLPNKFDVGWNVSAVVNGATSQTDLYFDRYSCGTRTMDVWVAPGVAPGM